MGCCAKDEESDVGNDADFDGPVSKRKCQDVFWLIIFLLFLLGMFVAIGYAVSKGDVDRILNGMDSYGNVCGKKNKRVINFPNNGQDYTNKPFRYRGSSVTANYTDYEVLCMDECPANHIIFLNRCVPSSNAGLTNSLGSQISLFQKAAEGVQYCWKEIVYLCIIALGLTMIMMFLLRYATAFIVYLVIVTMICMAIALTAYCWYKYVQANKLADEAVDKPNYSALKSYSKSWLIGAIIATVFCVLFLLLLFVTMKEIKLVIQLIKEAGKAIGAMPLILIQPVWTFLFVVFIGVTWLYALMWMQSSGELVIKNGKVRLETDTFIKVMLWYHLFALIWMMWFCFGCQNIVIAGAVAKWFFTRDKTQLGSPILTAVFQVIRYHIGSVALGSLIISIIKFIRVIVHYLEKTMRDSSDPKVACLFTIIQCCVSLLEDIIKFITRNAYIAIAIYGFSFCKSAKKSFTTLVDNCLRVGAINSTGDFVLLMCKGTVVFAVAFIGMEIIKKKEAVVHVWVPVVIACLFAYLVADCFLSVYEMVIDTLFLCFAEDCERNDGIERPYFMSASLMEFVESNKKESKPDGNETPETTIAT